MGLITDDGIAVVESGRGLKIETYASKLDVVLQMMNNGSLGGGNGYGCDEHIAALAKIEAALPTIREQIEAHNNPPKSDCDEDEGLIQQCIEIIRHEQKASVSILQRRLHLGYTRTWRIMDELERRNIVGPAKGAEPRDILIDITKPTRT